MASRGAKWLIGCGIGCGSVAVLVVLVLISFGVWVTRPGQLIEPRGLLGPETTGYAEWTLSADDPGTERFVLATLEALQDAARKKGTPFAPALDSLFSAYQKRRNEKQLRQIFPLTVVWTSRPAGEPGRQLHVLALSLERIGNQVRAFDWLFGWILSRDDDSEVQRHGDESIYVIHPNHDPGPHEPNEVIFFIRGNDLIFTSDLETARSTIDRLSGRATAPAGPPSELDRLLASLPPATALRAAVINGDGEALRVAETLLELAGAPLPPRELWQELRGLTLTGGLVEDGSFAGALELWCPDPRWATDHAEPIAAGLAGLGGDTLEVELTSRAIDDRIRLDLRVPDLARLPARKLN